MPQPVTRTWRLTRNKTTYLTSTSPTLLSHHFIQSAFATKDMYWAQPLSPADLGLLLSSSLNLGLYILHPRLKTDAIAPPRTVSSPSTPREGSPTTSLSSDAEEKEEMDEEEVEVTEEEIEASRLEQIGFARYITDHVTTFYLTDVFIAPEHRGTGLGKWLIGCCEVVLKEAKMMRRALLMASPGEGTAFYKRELDMYDIKEEGHVVCMTRRRYVDVESDNKHSEN